MTTPCQGRCASRNVFLNQSCRDPIKAQSFCVEPSRDPVPLLRPHRSRKACGVRNRLVFTRWDADVVAWLRDRGRGYQTRLNRVLREAMLADIQESA
jgi:uncharacterized protein (DUF4415 family)